MKHPFPGIELEREFDRAVVEIDEAVVFGKADVLDVEQRGRKARLPRGIFEIGQRAGIFRALQHSGQVQVMRAAKLSPRLDQALVDRIELVGGCGNDLPFDRLFQPGPLEHRGFEDRGRGVGIVFQKFRRPMAVETKVEPAIEAELIVVPAVRYQRPVGLLYLQPL